MMMEDEIITRLEVDEGQNKMQNDPNSMKKNRTRLTFPFGACRVCSDSATGIHYGIATCEGCKGFFKRSILRKEKYRCYFDNSCQINVTNRNRCKACRFRHCLDEGMSVDGVKMGRIPKLVKERALREQKEQQLREEAALAETNEKPDEVRARESSCSSSSDRSVENDDPDPIEIVNTKLASNTNRRPCELYVGNSGFNSNSSMNSSQDLTHVTRPFPETRRFLRFLPDDFTIDETVGLTVRNNEPLPEQFFQFIRTISTKLVDNRSYSYSLLTDDESRFIGFLRSSAHDVYIRHSKRVKQVEVRMQRMVAEGIDDSLDDNASMEHFLSTLPKTLEVTVRSSVSHVQELPGMTNMGLNNLHQMILHRAFDWFLLKYNSLLNENGRCYFVSSDGFPYTRRWLHVFYGLDMTDGMFEFAQHIRDLALTDREIALVAPIQICYAADTMQDQETPRMLRSCYLYALYDELRSNRGEQEGKLLCAKILKVLDLLTPLRESYEKNVGSRLVQA